MNQEYVTNGTQTTLMGMMSIGEKKMLRHLKCINCGHLAAIKKRKRPDLDKLIQTLPTQVIDPRTLVETGT